MDGSAQASWTFSLPKVGEPIQHYRLEDIPWHAGLPGDRRTDTALIGNLTLVGKEHEGKKGEPWTENQIFWSARIDVALRQLCPAFGVNPPTLRLNMWEHNWLSATSCPSGRNPWSQKFAAINELEDGMTEAEFNAMFDKRIRTLLGGHVTKAGETHFPEMRFRAESRDGKALAAVTTLKRWFGVVDEHRKDKGKHSAGEGHDHEFSGRTKEA